MTTGHDGSELMNFPVIVTIEILDWPDEGEFPAVLAIPARLTVNEWSESLGWPQDGGFEKLADRVLEQIDWTVIDDTPPWEIRGIRIDDSVNLDNGDTPQTIGREVYMPNGPEDVTKMLKHYQAKEDAEMAAHERGMNP